MWLLGFELRTFRRAVRYSYPLSHLTSLDLVFEDRVFLCSPGSPGTGSVDKAGLELGSIWPYLLIAGIKGCATTTAWQLPWFLFVCFLRQGFSV
jgi:hypothetical protein